MPSGSPPVAPGPNRLNDYDQSDLAKCLNAFLFLHLFAWSAYSQAISLGNFELHQTKVESFVDRYAYIITKADDVMIGFLKLDRN